jgi:hypothetical protein
MLERRGGVPLLVSFGMLMDAKVITCPALSRTAPGVACCAGIIHKASLTAHKFPCVLAILPVSTLSSAGSGGIWVSQFLLGIILVPCVCWAI